ncbi:LexA family protein [Moraxella bovis]|uniref:LexA family protein n=1 Tax=Moraxella bovis TaxID=476 RepID=UPI0022277578|nr:S24 family peptidase [Moraxella bovis]UZA09627.1 hypothetical protein LP108_04225 [Moraxella bovis]UZA36658.1 hypothetical protein LP098_06795 [Moraxella bovis]
MSKNDQILKTVPGPTPNNSFKDKGASENSHGGKRKGAGRKASAIKTVVKRVPSILVPMIDKMTENMMQTLANSAVIKSPNVPLDAMIPANDDTDMSVLMSLAKVPAGLPAYNDGQSEEINLNDYLVGRQSDTFVVRCGGYSMLDAGIDKDDLLIIDRSVEPKHFDIVMADLGSECTIKRLHKFKDGRLELHSENEADPHPNFSFKDGDHMMVVGVVMHVIKSLR